MNYNCIHFGENLNFLLKQNTLKTNNTSIIIYNNNYIFSIQIHIACNYLHVCDRTNSIYIRNNTLNGFFIDSRRFYFFLKSLNYIFLNKVRFVGKGYRFIKSNKKKTIKMNFNRSHINVIYYSIGVVFRKLRKNKLLMFSYNYIRLLNLTRYFYRIRLNNIFTKRGIRLSRQKILKKKGKKSNYM